MKKIILFLVFIFLAVSLTTAAQEVLVPLYVDNYEIQKTIDCEVALFPIYRKIESEKQIKNTIKKLLSLEFTENEKKSGFSSEWTKNNSVYLRDISLIQGELVIELGDPLLFTSGGSMRVNSLKRQIERTALQFRSVDRVEFNGPIHLFQP